MNSKEYLGGMIVLDIFMRIYKFSTIFLPSILVILILFLYAKKNGQVYPLSKCVKIFIFVLYVFLVLDVTGAGTLYDATGYSELIRPDEITLKLFSSSGISTYLLNILMCVPFGILVPFIWPKYKFPSTVGLGFLFSLLIETSQLFNRRNTATDDLLMNTIGAAVGYGLYFICNKCFKHLQNTYPSNKFVAFLAPSPQVLVSEPLLFLVIMFAGHFLLYNWRAIVM